MVCVMLDGAFSRQVDSQSGQVKPGQVRCTVSCGVVMRKKGDTAVGEGELGWGGLGGGWLRGRQQSVLTQPALSQSVSQPVSQSLRQQSGRSLVHCQPVTFSRSQSE